MPANCKRSWRPSSSLETRQEWNGQPDLVVVVVVMVMVERVLTHQLTFLTTCVTENLGTRAGNQDEAKCVWFMWTNSVIYGTML